MTISYELRQNLFFEAAIQQRNYSIKNIPGESSTTLVTAGVRLNIYKRKYDF